jgi:urea carboxylase-associated protein 2
MIMRRDHRLRLVDVEGGANVGMLFYNPINLLERYNAPDTLKCQHTFKLTQGHCLYSDMGRVFCSIVSDTAGWHDTVCGVSTKQSVAARWGEANYQTHRNDWQQNGRDSFLVEAAKYGLGRRDLAANVNWFSKVETDEAGKLRFDASAAKAGAFVVLRFEMDTLVLLHTCPHPLDVSAAYPRKPVRFEVLEGAPAKENDACRLSAPENGRGFENNRLFNAGCGCC